MRPTDHSLDTSPQRKQILDELREACVEFKVIACCSTYDLKRKSNGTKWTNRELLFHILFGYLITRTILFAAPTIARLPDRIVAAPMHVLSRLLRPFNWINYVGSVIGGKIYSPQRMVVKFEIVARTLEHQLARLSEEALDRRMAVPTAWDPFFTPRMTVEAIFRYPTQHFQFHAAQLSCLGIDRKPIDGG